MGGGVPTYLEKSPPFIALHRKGRNNCLYWHLGRYAYIAKMFFGPLSRDAGTGGGGSQWGKLVL